VTTPADAAYIEAWREKATRGIYVTTRHMMIGGILERARLGTLDPSWRTHLLTYFPAARSDATKASATLVQLEATDLPVQPWEPYAAGGDWREALDAWYSATLALEAEYEAEKAERPRPPADDSGGVDWLASAASGQQQQSEADRYMREIQRRERDCLGASYRAGLAAGGVEIDWVSWYRQRVTEWVDCGVGCDDDTRARFTESMRIDYRRHQSDQPGWSAYLQQLPGYWTASDPSRRSSSRPVLRSQ